MGAHRNGIDLIVVNYRSPVDLTGFLASVLVNPPEPPWSLHVVNVAPQDDDLEVYKSFDRQPQLRGRMDHIVIPENVGYARAVNRASRLCVRETIGVFNADTRLKENVANECHNALHSKVEWGVLGPRQIDDEGRVTAAGIFGTNDRPQDRAFHHPNSDEYADVRDDAVTVSGSAYFIKATVWEELATCPIYRKTTPTAQGAFLPTPLYYEETFCSYHAREHGHKVVYYGAATMVHRWRKAPRTPGSDALKIQMSKKIFQRACDEHGIQHD